MKRTISFILGVIFGIVFLLGALGIALYSSITVVHPNEIYPDGEVFFGELGNMSVMNAYYTILQQYQDKINPENGDLYTIGEFLEDNGISKENENGETIAFGIIMPQELLDAPIFEYFDTEVDAEGRTGLQRAMAKIPVSSVPALVNLFATSTEGGQPVVSQSVLDVLGEHYLDELVFVENGDDGEGTSQLMASLANIFEGITLVDLVPSLIPDQETENQLKILMNAIGNTDIGKLISGLTGDQSLFVMLRKDGALEEVGTITIGDLLGEEDQIISMVGAIAIADLVDEEGNLVLTDALSGIYAGSLLSLVKRPTTVAEGTTPTAIYTTVTNEDGTTTQTVKFWVATTADSYAISADYDSQNPTLATWYEGKFNCQDAENHTADTHTAQCVYNYVWYQPCKQPTNDCAHIHVTIGEGAYYEASLLYDVIGNICIGDLLGGGDVFGELASKFTSLKVGDLLQSFNIEISGALEAIKDMTIDDLATGGYYNIVIGSLLGYKKYQNNGSVTNISTIEEGACYVGKVSEQLVMSTDQQVWYNAKFTCADVDNHTDSTHTNNCKYSYVWYAPCNPADCADATHNHVTIDNAKYVEAEGVFGIFAGFSIGDLVNGANLMDTVMGIKIKDLLGEDKVGGMLEAFGDLSIKDLTTDGALNGIALADILGYKRYEQTSVTSWTTVIANAVVSKTSGDTTVYAKFDGKAWYDATLKCDQAHTHTADCYAYVWYSPCDCTDPTHKHVSIENKNYTPVSGIFEVLAGLTIGDIINGEDIMDTLLDIKIKDLIGEDKVSGMLSAFGDLSINDLMKDGALNSIALADILGYKRYPVASVTTYTTVIENSVMSKTVGENTVYVKFDSADSVWYNAELGCRKTVHTHDGSCGGADVCAIEQHQHNADCYRYLWYQACATPNCANTAHDHVQIDGANHFKVGSIYSLLAEMTIGDLIDVQSGLMDKLLNDFSLVDILGEDKIPDMLQSVKHLPISQLSSEITSMKIGEILGYTEQGGIWYKANDDGDLVAVTGIEGKIAPKTIDDLKNLNGLLDELTLTDVMGAGVPDMLSSLANKPISQLGSEIEKLTIADIMGYTKELTCGNDSHEHTDTCYTYYDKNHAPVAGIMAKFAGKKITELGDLTSDIQSFTLKELLGDSVPDILKSIENTKISEISTAIEGMHIGEFVGYTKGEEISTLVCSDPTHTTEEHHTDSCYKITYKWYSNSVQVEGMMAKLANETLATLSNINATIQTFTLKEVLGNAVPDMLKSIENTEIGKLDQAMNQLYLGDVLGYTKKSVAVCGDVTHVEDTDHIESCYQEKWFNGATQAEGMMAKLADKKLDELGNLSEDIKTFTLKEVLGNAVPDMLKSIENTEIGKLDQAMNQLYLGDVLGYTKKLLCTDASHVEDTDHNDTCQIEKWYDKTDVEVEGMMANFAGKKLSELGNLGDDIKTFTLAEVIGRNEGDNAILKELYDTQIKDISSSMDSLYVGTAMGYVRQADGDDYVKDSDGEYVWYVDNGNFDTVVGTPNSAFVNTTVTNMGNVITEVTLGELIDTSGSGILQALSNSKLDEIGNDLDGISMGAAMGYQRIVVDGVATTLISDNTRHIYVGEIGGKKVKSDHTGIWYETQLNCSENHDHTVDCYGYIWYELCTNENSDHVHETEDLKGSDFGITDTNASLPYSLVTGLNGKMANVSIEDLDGGDTVLEIVQGLTMGEMVENGILTFSDPDAYYKLSILYGECDPEIAYIEETGITYNTSTNTFETTTTKYPCTMEGYFRYRIVHPTVTAQEFWTEAHEGNGMTQEKLIEHRDLWKNDTLTHFIDMLISHL